MGDITYPRVDGVIFLPGAFQRPDGLYLPRKRSLKILRYPGWSFQKAVYVKRHPSDKARLRKEFSRVKPKFLKHLARTDSRLALDYGFTHKQIMAIASGIPPDTHQVHHIMPLDDGGRNEFDNLILIRNAEHFALSAFQNSFSLGLTVHESVAVDLPVPPDGRKVWPHLTELEPFELEWWGTSR